MFWKLLHWDFTNDIAWRWRKYMWLAIQMELLPLDIIAQRNDKAYLSQRQDTAAGAETAEPLVIPTLTVCLFSFVVGEHKMKFSNFENFKQKSKAYILRHTVFRGKTRRPSRNLTQKICRHANLVESKTWRLSPKKIFEPRRGEKHFLDPCRGSGGMLSQKIISSFHPIFWLRNNCDVTNINEIGSLSVFFSPKDYRASDCRKLDMLKISVLRLAENTFPTF